MDVDSRVRRACFKDGMSVRVAALYFSKDPKTVAMMLGHELPPSYRSYEIRRRATLDTFVGFIDLIVHTYNALIKTQRHTAKRKFKISHYENRRCSHPWGQNTRAKPPVHRAAITLFA
jgi:hypothetical protein